MVSQCVSQWVCPNGVPMVPQWCPNACPNGCAPQWCPNGVASVASGTRYHTVMTMRGPRRSAAAFNAVRLSRRWKLSGFYLITAPRLGVHCPAAISGGAVRSATVTPHVRSLEIVHERIRSSLGGRRESEAPSRPRAIRAIDSSIGRIPTRPFVFAHECPEACPSLQKCRLSQTVGTSGGSPPSVQEAELQRLLQGALTSIVDSSDR
eukprot:Polyplicarium_translucidae@DN298_c0_g1_i1.p1